MGYEDRDYFRAEYQMRPSAPRLTPVFRIILFIYIGVNLALLFTSQSGEVGRAMVFREGLAGFMALGPGALIPSDAGWTPWHIVTAPLAEFSLFSVILTCLITLWWIGSTVESGLGRRRTIHLVLLAWLVPSFVSALIDPLILGVRMPPIAGATGFSMAIFGSLVPIAGNEKVPILNIRFRTLVIAFVILNLVLTAPGYMGGDGSPIHSIPALLAGIGVGWGAVAYWQRRGERFESSMTRARRQAEGGPDEDYLEFAKRFSVQGSGASAPGGGIATQKPKRASGRQRILDEAKVRAALERLTNDGFKSLGRAEKSLVKQIIEQDEQRVVDALLDRIAREGMSALSPDERKMLERASKARRS